MNVEKLDGVLRNFSNSSNPFALSGTTAEKVSVAVANGNSKSADVNELDLTAKRMDFTMNGTAFGGLNSDVMNGGKKADAGKREIPIDLLNDVATAAFNEFSNAKYKNHEFINKIATVDRVGGDFENSRIMLKWRDFWLTGGSKDAGWFEVAERFEMNWTERTWG